MEFLVSLQGAHHSGKSGWLNWLAFDSSYQFEGGRLHLETTDGLIRLRLVKGHSEKAQAVVIFVTTEKATPRPGKLPTVVVQSYNDLKRPPKDWIRYKDIRDQLGLSKKDPVFSISSKNGCNATQPVLALLKRLTGNRKIRICC